MTELLDLISNLGFPVCMCLLLFYRMNKESDLHKEEIKELTDVIAKNTLAIEKLNQHLGE